MRIFSFILMIFCFCLVSEHLECVVGSFRNWLKPGGVYPEQRPTKFDILQMQLKKLWLEHQRLRFYDNGVATRGGFVTPLAKQPMHLNQEVSLGSFNHGKIVGFHRRGDLWRLCNGIPSWKNKNYAPLRD